jgi:hypothetical protein
MVGVTVSVGRGTGVTLGLGSTAGVITACDAAVGAGS